MEAKEEGCRCVCSPCERYLATGAPPTGCLERANYGDDDAGADEALMHVLVTRPEIVGKPRDNIVFEGDMDLRTTFETSYEALAKMRLKCWRRHQEMLEAKRAKCCASAEANGAQGACDSRAERPNLSEAEENTSDRQQAVSVDHKQLAWMAGGDCIEDFVDDREPELRSVEPSGLSVSSSSSSPEAAECRRDQPGGSKRVDVAVQADLVPSPSQPATPATTATPHPSLQHQKGFQAKIDPDLTPIIVYDANMNRLERVGLRKRSKYRPSTSLRSGARGLFGDQEEANGPKACGSCQVSAQTSGNAQTSPKAADSHQMETMAQNYTNNTTGRPWDSEPTVKTELALNSRNLKDSNQKDYLMYTDGNLPIDCKRKLRGNVNMIDHIKEGDICESKQPMKENSFDVIDELQQRDQHQQEEEDAVEEIQNITGQEDWCIQSHRGTDKSEADKDERKLRLKRTCQNQNFDIHDNNYEEDSTTSVSRTEDRVARRDLFRESPDFIMTTGKFMDHESKINKKF